MFNCVSGISNLNTRTGAFVKKASLGPGLIVAASALEQGNVLPSNEALSQATGSSQCGSLPIKSSAFICFSFSSSASRYPRTEPLSKMETPPQFKLSHPIAIPADEALGDDS